ncbi:MAG: hypothetical protein V7K21_22415 [Nostoc sp.]|uniref:hypothetical protein n=1 Tax=Nostoc sp. TaxID=1180 RepID=UPI002FF7F3A4
MADFEIFDPQFIGRLGGSKASGATLKDGVAKSWDDFAQFARNFQWFQLQIHPTFMQRLKNLCVHRSFGIRGVTAPWWFQEL